jgi:hypothetical protein
MGMSDDRKTRRSSQEYRYVNSGAKKIGSDMLHIEQCARVDIVGECWVTTCSRRISTSGLYYTLVDIRPFMITITNE